MLGAVSTPLLKCTFDGRFGLEAKAGEKRKPEAKEAPKKQPSAVSPCPHSACTAAPIGILSRKPIVIGVEMCLWPSSWRITGA